MADRLRKAFTELLAPTLREKLRPRGRHCPDAGVLAAYYEGGLGESEARECELHVSICEGCQQQLAAMVRLDVEGVRAEDEASEDVGGFAWRRSWRWAAPVALAASALLALTVTLRNRGLIDEATRMAAPVEQSTPAEEPTPGASPTEAVATPTVVPPFAAADERIEAPPPQPAAGAAPAGALPARQATGGAAESAYRAPAREAPMAAQMEPTPEPTSAPRATAPMPEPAPLAAPKLPSRLPAPAGKSMLAADGPAPSSEVESRAAVSAPSAAGGRVVWRIADGAIERSADGGRTWSRQRTGADGTLVAASAPSSTVCWAVGKRGTVLRTLDGQHWQRLKAPTAEDLVRVTADEADTATVHSASGERLVTNDGGQTWHSL